MAWTCRSVSWRTARRRLVRSPDPERAAISTGLAALEERIQVMERQYDADIGAVRQEHHEDAVNLVHYLALRQTDLRSLQHLLGQYGLSSLGRCEPHVLATVKSVRAALDHLPTPPSAGPLGFQQGRGALDRNTDALFGPRPQGRVVRIMVTFPTEAADDYQLVHHLVAEGMDVARINGAHDCPAEWEHMALNVRRASVETGRTCRVSMDLPGPEAADRHARRRPESGAAAAEAGLARRSGHPSTGHPGVDGPPVGRPADRAHRSWCPSTPTGSPTVNPWTSSRCGTHGALPARSM